MAFIERMTTNKKKIFILLIIIAIISSVSLFLIPNISWGHDLDFHLSRILSIKENIGSGQFGNYIYPNYLDGYGYGNPLFYPDVFLYIPAFLAYLGMNIITAYKLLLFMISLGAVTTMFYAVKKITKDKNAALFSSIVYGFSSYRLVDLFTRAALGESLSFVFAPLIIYGIYEIVHGNYKKNYILVFGMVGIILSHIISTYMIILLLFIYCLVNIKKLFSEKKRIVYLIIATVLTLLITGFFIFPMIEQMIHGTFSFNLDGYQLFYRAVPIWCIFFEIPTSTFIIPWIPPGIGVSFLILCYIYIKKYNKENKLLNFCFISGILLLLSTTEVFPWKIFGHILAPLQFPWRLYFLVIVLFSLGSGILFNKFFKLENKIFKIILIFSIIPVIIIGICNFKYKKVESVDKYYESFGEYLPAKFEKEYAISKGDTISSEKPADINFIRNNSKLIITIENSDEYNELELPLIYYKGYQAIMGDNRLEVFETENGLVGLKLENITSGDISVKYGGTLIQKISKIVSLAGGLILVFYLIIKKKKEKNVTN